MSAWTDDPATTSTHIRTVHINELRRAINFYRQLKGLPAFNWTDGPWVATSTHIRAVHFTELRSAIQDLWNAHVPSLGTIPNWSVGSAPSTSRQVSARDMNDLRTGSTKPIHHLLSGPASIGVIPSVLPLTLRHRAS